MAQNLPYVLVGGTLTKILEKVRSASVPERFTQDFLSTKLGFKGGNARAVIPYAATHSFPFSFRDLPGTIVCV